MDFEDLYRGLRYTPYTCILAQPSTSRDQRLLGMLETFEFVPRSSVFSSRNREETKELYLLCLRQNHTRKMARWLRFHSRANHHRAWALFSFQAPPERAVLPPSDQSEFQPVSGYVPLLFLPTNLSYTGDQTGARPIHPPQ